MSKVNKWQYDDFFLPKRKEKLVNMLISEIIFLKNKLKANDEAFIKTALNKLESLLKNVNSYETDISENDFDKVILMIYNIFRLITEEIEEK